MESIWEMGEVQIGPHFFPIWLMAQIQSVDKGKNSFILLSFLARTFPG